jgi:hypothetical protein
MADRRKSPRSVLEKLSLGDGALRMMQTVFGGGAAKRPAPVDREKLETTIARINTRFGLALRLTDAAFHELTEELPWVAGQFEGDTPTVTKRHLKTRLTRLKSHVQGAIQILKPVRAMEQEETGELEFVLFLFAAIADQKGETTGLPARARLESILGQLEEVVGYCDCAESKLPSLKAKTGRRSIAFYEDFVALMIRFARQLGLEHFSASSWDSRHEEKTTAFTALVYDVERFLPRAARSNTVAACAARINGSFKKLDARKKRVASVTG